MTATDRRQRKVLPPLSPAPSSVDGGFAPLEADAVAPLSAAAADAPLDGLLETKAEVEQLLRHHIRFARAFRVNDTAQILPFLDRDVTLRMADGTRLSGASAVLGCLVGTKMAKLSTLLHVRGAPTRAGPWQSVFVYEHGRVFKEPLYSELIEWKPNSNTILSIVHTSVMGSACDSHGLTAKLSTSAAIRSSQQRRSDISNSNDAAEIEDEDGEDQDEALWLSQRGMQKMERRSSLSRTSSSSSNTSNPALTVSASALSSSLTGARGVSITKISVLSRLQPVRKRKLVNPFMTIEMVRSGACPVWKSTVARKQERPTWAVNDVELTGAAVDNPVVVTLWDQGIFRSIRVASTELVLSELLTDDTIVKESSLRLRPTGISSDPVEVAVRVQRIDADASFGMPARSSLPEQASSDVASEQKPTTASTIPVSSTVDAATGSGQKTWLVAPSTRVSLALALAVVLLALLWRSVLQLTSSSEAGTL
ncbi:hypothetical protein P43SY_001315 [Pythium insidiosum]|uniref:C2 domain-containing protein n=1 Tax=Pythium insidiosum TaxID=114742 RepID=A0AAD5LKQ2_PYTIN|nr:hypothetical protein P43SY_001315 [Pythium insidiosum]